MTEPPPQQEGSCREGEGRRRPAGRQVPAPSTTTQAPSDASGARHDARGGNGPTASDIDGGPSNGKRKRDSGGSSCAPPSPRLAPAAPADEEPSWKGNSNDKNSNDDPRRRSGRRPECGRCRRPTITCLCSSLPDRPLTLQRCRCLVLQHPQELQRKNRSLPLVQLCLESKTSLSVVVNRRLFSALNKSAASTSSNGGRGDGDEATENGSDGEGGGTRRERAREPTTLSPETLDLLRKLKSGDGDSCPLWLVYPHPDAVPLRVAVRDHLQQREPKSVVTLLFFDATWKYGAEMDRYHDCRIGGGGANALPGHTLRVQLDEEDLRNLEVPGRFAIRTPKSERHLSTAECLAYAVAQVEGDPTIYDTIMKPLDWMVEQWQSFRQQKNQNNVEKKHNNSNKSGNSNSSDICVTTSNCTAATATASASATGAANGEGARNDGNVDGEDCEDIIR